MRVTNRMMTTDMLNNINRNKNNVSKLGYQQSTQQKIERPSDDPVVAVRSLKYRTQLTELSQYVDKNIPDAMSWMDITESAMTSANDLLSKMYQYFNNGSTDTLETKDRNSITEALNEYKKQFYDLANSDYAGRYVFTGYRTDTPLLFDKNSLKKLDASKTIYTINEPLAFSNLVNRSYVSGGAIYEEDTTADEYAGAAATTKSANILSLSYRNLDKAKSTTETIGGKNYIRNTGIQGITFTAPTGEAMEVNYQTGEVYEIKADGTRTKDLSDPPIYKITTKSLAEGVQGACYDAAANEIIFIPETGELVFGTKAFDMAHKYSDINVQYTKSNFAESDIRPEHYFECTTNSLVVDTTTGEYKKEEIYYSNPQVQKIEYEVNFSQKLTVNTLAKDSFSTGLATQIDQIIRHVNDVFHMDDRIKEVDKLIATQTSEEEIANLKELRSLLETEQTLKKSVLQQSFSSALGVAKKTEETMNVALANHGSRYLRLEIIQSRLETQQIDFQEILDNNDTVDLEDAIINYKQAQVIYDASLACASTVVSKTLLDYIR